MGREVFIIPLGNNCFALPKEARRLEHRGSGGKEQSYKAGHLLTPVIPWQVGTLQKVGCSSTEEPLGGPGLPSNLYRRRKAGREPRNPESNVRWVRTARNTRALPPGILLSQSISGN